MAATKGHGNPDWSRDETILALDLYFKLKGQIPGPTDPSIVALSQELRAMPFHEATARKDSFRNADGVGFKLQNLRTLAVGRGLSNVSAIDRAVWRDFGGNADKVHALAQSIRDLWGAGGVTPELIALVDDEEEFVEGKIVTVMHRSRERNPKLRKKLLKSREAQGPLSCDGCDEGPKSTDPELAAAGYEAHHKIPLASTTSRTTKISDLALVCATCHRLIHRAMHQQQRWLSIPDFRKLIRHQ